MRILGIDPGFGRLGWAIVDTKGQGLSLVACGCFETDKIETEARRLSLGYDELTKLIKKFKPEKAAVESLFFFKNAKTVIGVAQSRGSALVALEKNGVPCVSFTPLQVKSSITGHGRADKSQVQNMVKRLLKLDSVPKPDDAADACAVAIALAFAS